MTTPINNRLPEIIIRPFTESDSLEALTLLLNRAYRRLLEQGLQYSAATQNPEETRRRIANHTCYIAVANESIVGSILYRSHTGRGGPPWYDHPNVAVFFQVAVDSAWQSQGLGRMLLDYVEQKAFTEGASEIAADTAVRATRLLDMYKRRGYRIVDYTYWPNANYRSAIFSKRLRDDAPVKIGGLTRALSRYRARLRQIKWRLLNRLFPRNSWERNEP